MMPKRSITPVKLQEEKSRVVLIMTEIDPGNKTKYQKITAGNLP